MNLALVVAAMRSGERGGAEALYDGLERGLRSIGHDVDRLEIALDESTFDQILESYARANDLDLRGYDGVISTKAPTYMVRHPHHVCWLVHTIRVFYDRFEPEYGAGTAEQHRQRRIVQALDRHGLAPDRVLRHFAIGHTPYRRLRAADPFWSDVPFEAVHLPPAIEGFRAPEPGRYAFLPGRLHRWKRVHLLIEAWRRVRADVPLKIAGTGEDEARLRELAAGDPRIEFLGRVDDRALLDLYAGAIAVPFVPVGEDYGLVAVEAFLTGKPVITCTDSGEPAEIVRDGVSGLVVEPTPAAIAAALDTLIADPGRAAAMGLRGRESVDHLTWPSVATRLAEPIQQAIDTMPRRRGSAGRAGAAPVSVLVTDNQCIEPATGGGRLRLLGLYSTLTDDVSATYVGTYDWPGPGHRDLVLSPRLREIDVPLSDEHFRLNAHLNSQLPGTTIIDVTIPWLISSSPDLVDTVRRHAAEADVVVFSHPWMYPCLRDRLDGVRVVYDSHNCEARLRASLLGATALGRALAESVRWVEGELCRRSDLILACSEEDRAAFVELYGVPRERVRLVPNGVDVAAIRPADEARRSEARRALGLSAPVAVFVGSGYPPNVEAYAFIVDRVAPRHPGVTFLIVGSVSEHPSAAAIAARAGANVRALGQVSDAERNQAYAAADLAVNPMFTGSGVNIKMLDFFAAGLPTLATPMGARGIPNPGGACFLVADAEPFAAEVGRLATDEALRADLAARARRLAEERYDWRRISRDLGVTLAELAGRAREAEPAGDVTEAPFFSVVIPTYQRPELLRALLERLEQQTYQSFEVVVVDQSAPPFDPATVKPSFPLEFIHTDVAGATRARNLGVARARGYAIAFTDDDCQPDPAWLANGRRYFDDSAVVGVEGLIESDTYEAEKFRIVKNVGFEGFGFMTANLLLRRDVIQRIGGFDERFDHPHFREDSDLAWRALRLGRIPFGRDVRVLHPAHRIDIQRESKSERLAFFVHDALLYAKHPHRYLSLMKAEGHYQREDAFWTYFLEGLARHRVDVSLERIAPFMPADVLRRAREVLARLPIPAPSSPRC